MVDVTGFYSEHTAEYVLAPRLATILRSAFKTVIPFYFWANREGTNLSKLMAPASPVRLIAVFPRRPKHEGPEANSLLAKLNAELYDHANVAQALGIPVIAGLPLAWSLFDLSMETDCAWFAITATKGPPADVLLEVDKAGQILCADGTPPLANQPLSDDEIREMALRKAKPMTWEAAIHAIRESRRGRMTWRFPFWGGSRKPFHIACIDPLEA